MNILSAYTLLLVAFSAPSGVGAFAFFGKQKAAVATPLEARKASLCEEALAVYDRAFPKRRKSTTRPFFLDWGVPSYDIDGTKLKKKRDNAGKSFTDRTEQELRATFTELAKVYGDNEALQMVKDEPIVLTASKVNFAPSLKEFGATFGDEAAKSMVQRNPSLVFCKPTGFGGADTADDLTMQMSYVVSATRPIGKAGPLLLIALLSSPAIEALTGIPVRTSFLEFFSALTK